RQDERTTERVLDSVLRAAAVAQRPEHDDPAEGEGHRPDGQPLHQVTVDRALANVNGAADRLHDHGGHEVARDGGQRLNLEDQHQNGRHQRPATHAGKADGKADNQPGKSHPAIEMHAVALASRAAAWPDTQFTWLVYLDSRETIYRRQ